MEASRRVIIIIVAGPDNVKKRIASYRSNLMNLTETIYAHVRALPADLQRETLDFITYLEMRYKVTACRRRFLASPSMTGQRNSAGKFARSWRVRGVPSDHTTCRSPLSP